MYLDHAIAGKDERNPSFLVGQVVGRTLARVGLAGPLRLPLRAFS